MSTPNPTDLRIVSLLPSATEIVCRLGFEDQLVAISHECDFPSTITDLPRITSSKVSFSFDSLAIDKDVRRLLEHALAVYDIDTVALERLAPDVIVTQDLCDVCAVSLADVEAACAEVVPGARIANLHPTRWGEVLDDIRSTAVTLGAPMRGDAVCAELEAGRAAVRDRCPADHKPKVLTIEWLDPVMIGGTWMPELVADAGGEALVTVPGDHAPTLDRDALANLRPDVVLLKPCGFDLARSHAEDALIARQLDGLPWPALEQGRVYLADGNAFFNRPGPRLLESLEILAACVHPEVFGDLAERHASSFERLAL